MDTEQQSNYNSHAKFLADIALAILEGNKNVIDTNGVKEIISLYLLIPYITPDTLQTPSDNCIIPKIGGDFCGGITLEDLRNGICHSFVTVEENKHDGTAHGTRLIFDDRVMYRNRKSHADLGAHSTTRDVLIECVNKRLTDIFTEIKNA